MAACWKSSAGMIHPSCLSVTMPVPVGEHAEIEWYRTAFGNIMNGSIIAYSLNILNSEFTYSYFSHNCIIFLSLGSDCRCLGLRGWAGGCEHCRIFLRELSYASMTVSLDHIHKNEHKSTAIFKGLITFPSCLLFPGIFFAHNLYPVIF